MPCGSKGFQFFDRGRRAVVSDRQRAMIGSQPPSRCSHRRRARNARVDPLRNYSVDVFAFALGRSGRTRSRASFAEHQLDESFDRSFSP